MNVKLYPILLEEMLFSRNQYRKHPVEVRLVVAVRDLCKSLQVMILLVGSFHLRVPGIGRNLYGSCNLLKVDNAFEISSRSVASGSKLLPHSYFTARGYATLT